MSQYSENTLATDNKNTAWMQVLELVENDWTILDVGCSSGNLGEELIHKKNAVVDGIEIDEADAMLASKKLRQVEVLNIETTPDIKKIFQGTYDAILFIDVIEHLVDPVTALRNIHKLLKPNGYIIFSVPNMAHLSVRMALLEGDFTYTKAGLLDKTHMHFYTGNEIKRVFTEAQYEIKTFTCSSLQYPEFLHEKKLAKLGLVIKDKQQFLKVLDRTHANVYQYVGTAQYKDSGPIKQPPVPRVNPHEKDYKMLQKNFNDYQDSIRFLKDSVRLKDNHINNLENQISSLDNHTSNLEKIIEDLKNSTISNRLKQKLKHGKSKPKDS